MKTVIHFYSFNTDIAEQAEAYAALRAQLLATPGRGHCMDAAGNYSQHASSLDGVTIELEAAHLFENQWNTAPIDGVADKGLRVFDWAETARSGSAGRMVGNAFAPLNVRRGHYLDITDEMLAARSETVGCGYCGKQQPKATAPAFCDKCLGSAYLKEADLHLLRLRPIADDKPHASRAPLTEEERADLLPRFVEAQTVGGERRALEERAKQRARVERLTIEAKEKAANIIRAAEREREGKLWLLNRGFNVDNVIYYSHTQRFSFGWRGDDGLDDSVVDRLLEVISDFPAPYDIQTSKRGKYEGRTLSGD